MELPFFDRDEETARLARLVESREGSLGVLYGRRRCGKSRLLREVLPPERSIYYVGDEREGPLQRTSLAAEIARLLPEFDRVTYPDWDSLFARFWSEADPRTALILDELPALVAEARELPSVLQKHIDRYPERGLHLLLAGSSQRMMQGLVLDARRRCLVAPERSSRSLLSGPAGFNALFIWTIPSRLSRPARSGVAFRAIGSSRAIIRTLRRPS